MTPAEILAVYHGSDGNAPHRRGRCPVCDELAGLTVRPNAPVKNPRAAHGTRPRYVAGCSGPLCRAANTAYINAQRAIARAERTDG